MTPSQPPPTLATFVAAALAEQAAPATDVASTPIELRYLLEQRARCLPDGGTLAAAVRAYRQNPAALDLPLLRLSQRLALTPLEELLIAMVLACEEDALLARVVCFLQAPAAAARPTVGLLAAALGRCVDAGPYPLATLLGSAAIATRILTLGEESSVLAERTVGLRAPLCLALRGQDGVWPGVTAGTGAFADVPLPDSVRAGLSQYAARLRSQAGTDPLMLRSASTAEGRCAAAHIAAMLDLRPAFLDLDTAPLDGLGAWALLRGLLPVLCLQLGPSEVRKLPLIAGYDGPMLVLCGVDGGVEFPSGPPACYRLPMPTRDEREALWRHALPTMPSILHSDLATHRYGSGRIAHLASMVRRIHPGDSNVDADSRPTRIDADMLREATWTTEGAGLGALAQPLSEPIPKEALVLPPSTQEELDGLLRRCQNRDTLIEQLGIAATARYRPGVRALLVGPSGTGKTLVAGWLATQLNMPLYRVDLAAVTSKYIGETEKNLAALLARAEESEIVLLFDEADSLFGKRTEISDSNDRFANAQTNYLLQRIEAFDGIAILTSNSRDRFDSAFTRRLDMILELLPPGPEQRRDLWRSHLGPRCALTEPQLNFLSTYVDLCGGHIRSIVLHAAALHPGPIDFAAVLPGIRSEYRKLGRPQPAALSTLR